MNAKEVPVPVAVAIVVVLLLLIFGGGYLYSNRHKGPAAGQENTYYQTMYQKMYPGTAGAKK